VPGRITATAASTPALHSIEIFKIMHLPTPQFSRLVTVLAFDLANPSLDSMILAWDHIAERHLRRLSFQPSLVGRIESVRLLAIHDAVISIFGPGEGFVFRESSTGTSISAALAAAAQASHDIPANAFADPDDLADLGDGLDESLSLISDTFEKSVGQATGAASAAAFLATFGDLKNPHRFATELPSWRISASAERPRVAHAFADSGWRRSA
jgi:hypothetical protein